MSFNYALIRTTLANIAAGMVVASIVHLAIFDGRVVEAVYLLIGGFGMGVLAVTRRTKT